MFLYGLSDSIKDEIYPLELPTSVDGLIDLAVRVDARLQRRSQRPSRGLPDEHMDLSNVPLEYLDLKRVFSKSRAASLPPHRPYDCAIDLLPESIVPQEIFVSAVTWEIESKVRTASQGVTPPPGCPPGCLFVPECLRSEVIRWGHCSKLVLTAVGFTALTFLDSALLSLGLPLCTLDSFARIGALIALCPLDSLLCVWGYLVSLSRSVPRLEFPTAVFSLVA
ncbi:hypothetical protein QQF64_036436 [Cirrhinus molitorella]|uniref:Uncharacterized protein n=1 Tax=Cirrhinus molitorella TaxID=172907 RepID=A0ABR3NIJ4_9TELE